MSKNLPLRIGLLEIIGSDDPELDHKRVAQILSLIKDSLPEEKEANSEWVYDKSGRPDHLDTKRENKGWNAYRTELLRRLGL